MYISHLILNFVQGGTCDADCMTYATQKIISLLQKMDVLKLK